MNHFVLVFCILSCTLILSQPPSSYSFGQPRKLDEFGDVACEDELARLDMLDNALRESPEAQACIIVYGGRRGRRNEAKARGARMKFYLIKIRGINAKRIFTFDGGYREQITTELWLIQNGEQLPTPTPSVDAKGVRLRGRVKVRGYYCGEGLG
jgi:hypothetical protein